MGEGPSKGRRVILSQVGRRKKDDLSHQEILGWGAEKLSKISILTVKNTGKSKKSFEKGRVDNWVREIIRVDNWQQV